ncbi:MAG: glutamate-5-semialdehyde dehydrogenase [Prevotella sp.]
MSLKDIFQQTKSVCKQLVSMNDEQRNLVLRNLSEAIHRDISALLEANRSDLNRMDPNNPLYDRLQLTKERLEAIAQDILHVADLPSPLNRILKHTVLENGLDLQRISVPFGVIGVIYEARPNVTFDVFSLCFKAGNACLMKGGQDADASNQAIIKLIRQVLQQNNIDPAVATLLPSTHEATSEMLNAVGYIDLCIPRGGKKLIDFVRNTAKIPVIETGAGVVNTYFDVDGDIEKGRKIIDNAKTRRPAVCNALDCLIIHEQRLNDLIKLCYPLTAHQVKLYADQKAYQALQHQYPSALLFHADDGTFGTEFMNFSMAIKTVSSLDEALRHIEDYGSGHSECIITENAYRADLFLQQVDAACVYVNAPTSFTDGGQFGLGAEIGISTQKLGPRGPMGLEEITTYKWIVRGNGQIRP